MNIKYLFVLGFLSISVFAEEQIVEPEKPSQPEKVSEKEALPEVKAEVNFEDAEKNDEIINKEVVENVENTDNGVKASASATASFNFNFEEFLAKWLQDCKQKKENNDEGEGNETNVEEKNKEAEKNKGAENNQEAEHNAQSEENSAEEMKSPCNYYFDVHARSSSSARSSATASASSAFYFNFYHPKEDEGNGKDANAEEPKENDDGEQPFDVENIEVPEHCNQQNSEDKEPLNEELLDDEPLKTEDETQVEEVEQ